MPNYFDSKNEEAKKFWEWRTKRDKLFGMYFGGMIVLYVVFFILGFFNKLTVDFLLLLTFASFCFMMWHTNTETQDLHNRINIIEKQFDEEKF